MEASKLKEILEQHKLWIETNGVQGERANLEGAYLGGANLRGAELTHADLTHADLTHADLRGANLTYAILRDANLRDANLTGAKLTGANLEYAKLTGATGLPDISWIIPGCLVQLNKNMYGFYLEKERKWYRFVQDTFGFFIQNNGAEETFDMLAEDQIIRGIPDWVKYSGLKQIASESV